MLLVLTTHSSFTFFPLLLILQRSNIMANRKRKPTNGRVLGVKFAQKEQSQETDLKKEKARMLKELEEKQQGDDEWFDKELDKHLKGR